MTKAERKRRYRERFPDSARSGWLKAQYGIDATEYDAMLERQKGVCAICGKPEHRIRQGKVLRLAVDHCHTTGAVRGLLCSDCNTGLARFGDDPTRLLVAVEYLADRLGGPR